MERGTKNFKASELRCKCPKCNEEVPHKIHPRLLFKIQKIRDIVGRPLTVTSAYRCKDHPNEIHKVTPGQHHLGLAVDFAVSNGAEAFQLIRIALEQEATGFAYGKGFVHIDFRNSIPVTWKY